jgi:Flp pilus assembly protein CpaB
MRPMTFVLLILILLVGAVALIFFFLSPGNGALGSLLPGAPTPIPIVTDVGENGDEVTQVQPLPTPTPAVRLVPVVVARASLSAGQRLTADLLTTELRPDDNLALQVIPAITYQNPDELVGRILKTDVAAGKEILSSFLALQPTDLVTMGSDLALYVDRGRVAVAFPIDRYSGVAYALRPGDQVDVLMSLNLVELDEEFQTALPNNLARVDRVALEDGQSFLFAPEAEGRLQLLNVINLVAQIGPQGGLNAVQIPRQVTQLTLQQVDVIWVGNWRNPAADMEQAFRAEPVPARPGEAQPPPEEHLLRPEPIPDMVILGVSLQDALTLNWAQVAGLNIQLALRAQGDNSVFVTTSVSLPQMAEQGPLTIPAPGRWGVDPRVDLVPTPGLPEVGPEFGP